MHGELYDLNGFKTFVFGGVNWWRAEFPTEQEFAHGLTTLHENNFSVDLVLTHDAPETYRNELNTDVPHSALNDYFEQMRN